MYDTRLSCFSEPDDELLGAGYGFLNKSLWVRNRNVFNHYMLEVPIDVSNYLGPLDQSLK
jgi:hypothetical protein